MHPTIIKRKEKADKLRVNLSEKYKHREKSFGQTVSYIHPALPDPFPNLRATLHLSKRRKDFHGQFYYIHTRDLYIEHLMPISEYYKIAFNTVAHKLHDLSNAINSARTATIEIYRIFQNEHGIRETTGQPYVHLGLQVQQLKEAVSAYLFISRSLFDCIASLFQFLYGHDTKYYDSFADFMNDLKSGKVHDPLMATFVEQRMTWFRRLRDLRDYITHFGSLDLGLYKVDSGELNIRVQSEFEIEELLNSSTIGISEFLTFYDSHFAERINADTLGQKDPALLQVTEKSVSGD
jgi:hypothetical protein